ncbi:MAG TPA: asparagine--tRNA ligase, partial [Phycisphaerae bacterium]|nr:asparagine--tRNA ligase [Phycisphaerae bacterium]
MQTTRVRDILARETAGIDVKVQGWVRTKRDAKGFSFIELNDGSALANIQIVVDESVPNYSSEVLPLTTGAAIVVAGMLVDSPGKGQKFEIRAREVTVYGRADPETYPLQKKRHSFEFLRTIAHLRPRTNTFGAIARVRSGLSFAIHKFFHDRGFVYIHTPIITASDCEGAGAMFRVTTLDLANPPRTPDGAVDFTQDFFGKPANLTVSGQLEGEIYATALTNVYTFGPTFRAENSNTTRHLAEFWMIEPEMAFCDLQGDMDLAEAFLKNIIGCLFEHHADEIEFFNQRIDNSVIATLRNILDNPFERLTYTDAIGILEKNNDRFEFKVRWGSDIQSEHERYLTEQVFKKPVIVTDYPKEIKAFYMKLNPDGRTVRAMDVLAPKIGEIIGGSQREDDLPTLEARMRECGLKPEDYWWYLDLRRYGSVPHAGFGLGFERLFLLVTGMGNIRDVIPFPRTP